jgi:Domain of unknown function DUF29
MPERAILAPPSHKLYEQDFCLWTQTMAEALKSGNFSQLDLENLAEEVESLGRSDRRELQSRRNYSGLKKVERFQRLKVNRVR